jgi:beta-galactosidase
MKLRTAVGAVLIAMSLLLAACAAHAIETASICIGWEYLQNNSAEPAKAITAGPWIPVDLPHTWNAFDSVDAVPGYRRDAGWHRKSITIARAARGTRHALLFEAANMKADVYVNGVRAAGHVGGYLPFEVDISNVIRPGPNEVLSVWITASTGS